MTRIKRDDKPRWRETAITERGRALCVANTPTELLIRAKGTRTVIPIPWALVWLRACELQALHLSTRRPRIRRGALAGL
jgi:hypothetical protein